MLFRSIFMAAVSLENRFHTPGGVGGYLKNRIKKANKRRIRLGEGRRASVFVHSIVSYRLSVPAHKNRNFPAGSAVIAFVSSEGKGLPATAVKAPVVPLIEYASMFKLPFSDR